MAEKFLRRNRFYAVPHKRITWFVDGHDLSLEIWVNDKLLKQNIITLPPTELGRCKYWRQEYRDDPNISVFLCTWDLRRVEKYLHLIDPLNIKLKEISVDFQHTI